jgi:hypothetical protein
MHERRLLWPAKSPKLPDGFEDEEDRSSLQHQASDPLRRTRGLTRSAFLASAAREKIAAEG